jgi:hypothetical protein
MEIEQEKKNIFDVVCHQTTLQKVGEKCINDLDVGRVTFSTIEVGSHTRNKIYIKT